MTRTSIVVRPMAVRPVSTRPAGDMLVPNVLAWMEESRQQTCAGVETRDVRPLMEVVIPAGQRQVFGDGRAVVLFGNDVIDVEG